MIHQTQPRVHLDIPTINRFLVGFPKVSETTKKILFDLWQQLDVPSLSTSMLAYQLEDLTRFEKDLENAEKLQDADQRHASCDYRIRTLGVLGCVFTPAVFAAPILFWGGVTLLNVFPGLGLLTISLMTCAEDQSELKDGRHPPYHRDTERYPFSCTHELFSCCRAYERSRFLIPYRISQKIARIEEKRAEVIIEFKRIISSLSEEKTADCRHKLHKICQNFHQEYKKMHERYKEGEPLVPVLSSLLSKVQQHDLALHEIRAVTRYVRLYAVFS
jgi:hypothetical protein